MDVLFLPVARSPHVRRTGVSRARGSTCAGRSGIAGGMSAIELLRTRTAAAHEAVDGAFGAFTLHSAPEYRRLLTAHAMALPVAELAAARVWPDLRTRVPLLTADLLALGGDMSAVPQEDTSLDAPASWGALYVVEGSRLGGGILATRIGEGLPRAYLSAVHRPGEWRAIRAAIDAAANGQDAAWHAAMIAGALRMFALYAASAEAVMQGARTA